MSLICIFQGGGGGGPTWPLDAVTSGLAFAYGRQRLLTSYSGPLYRVRRSSDNTEQDIAAATNGDDVPSLLTFVGSGSAYLTKWYDQSGHAIDLIQATTTKQPRVVDSGYALTNFQPDGVDDFIAATVPSYSSAFTSYSAGQIAPVPGTGNPIIYNIGGTKSQILAYSASSRDMSILVATGDMVTSDIGLVDTGRSWCTDLSLGGFNNQNSIRTTQASVATGTYTNNYSSAAFDAGALSMFSNGAGTGNFSTARMRAFVGYNAVHSSTTADTLTLALQVYPSQDAGRFGKFINGLHALYSLRQELASYTGNLIRVRRSSDNAEQDIGIATGILDTAALATFAGSSSCYVKTWYDQSGRGNDLTQTTTTKQPIIVNAGTYLTSIQFDGTDDTLTAPGPTSQALSIASRFQMRSITGAASFQSIINSVSNGSSGQLSFYIQFEKGSGKQTQYIFNTGSSYVINQSSTEVITETLNVYAFTGDPGTVNKRWINGSVSGTSSVGAGTISSANFFGNNFQIGGSDTNSNYAPVSFKNFFMWGCDQEGLVANINALL